MYYYMFLFWLACLLVSVGIKFGLLYGFIVYFTFLTIYAVLKDILTNK